jgi:hypothetical protein
MSNPLPGIYVIARGTSYELRCGGKTLVAGTMERELAGYEDRGLLASELCIHLKLPKIPTVLQVIKGGLDDVKLLVPTLKVIEPPPEGPRVG